MKIKKLCPFYNKQNDTCSCDRQIGTMCDLKVYWLESYKLYLQTGQLTSTSTPDSENNLWSTPSISPTWSSCNIIVCGTVLKMLSIWLTDNNKMYFLTMYNPFIRRATKTILQHLTKQDLILNENRRLQMMQKLSEQHTDLNKIEEIEKFKKVCAFYNSPL